MEFQNNHGRQQNDDNVHEEMSSDCCEEKFRAVNVAFGMRRCPGPDCADGNTTKDQHESPEDDPYQ
jgi:hypothetical protein